MKKKYVKICKNSVWTFPICFWMFFFQAVHPEVLWGRWPFFGGAEELHIFFRMAGSTAQKNEKSDIVDDGKTPQVDIYFGCPWKFATKLVSSFISPIYRTPNLWPFTSIYNPFTSVPAGHPKVVATPLKVSPLHIKRVYSFTDFWYKEYLPLKVLKIYSAVKFMYIQIVGLQYVFR